MFIKRALFLIYLYFFCILLSKAQSFERISNSQGFNQNTINSIQQDKYGFLWFATPNGLIRYDGYDFKTFTTQSNNNGRILSNYITSLYNDSNGFLWIATNVGLNVYVPSLEKFFTVPLEKTIHVKKIVQDNDNNIWFSTDSSLQRIQIVDIAKGLFNVSKNLLVLENNPKNLIVNTFEIGEKSSIILGTNEGLKKLSYEEQNKNLKIFITVYKDFSAFYDKTINTLIKAENIYWIGTNKGLYSSNLNTDNTFILKKIEIKNKENEIDINTIFQDHENNLWIGTKFNGVFKYNPLLDSYQHYEFNPINTKGISSHRINAIYQDNFNVIWIGTAQGGINKLDIAQKAFYTYNHNPYNTSSLPDNLITGILEDRFGKVWISSYNKKLSISKKPINEFTVKNLQFDDIESQIPINNTDIIRTIFEDNNGFIWFGTDEKTFLFNQKTKKFFTLKVDGNKLENLGFVRVIKQISESEIILAGNRVVVLNNPWAYFKSSIPEANCKIFKNSIEGNIQSFEKDKNNQFWIGTNRGLYQCNYDDSGFNVSNHYKENSTTLKLSNNNIFTLFYKDKVLWVGTFGGGLNKIILDDFGNPSKIIQVRDKDILPDNAIYGILPYLEKYLWVSTDMGLFKLNTEENRSNLFDVRDGLLQNNFRQKAFYKGNSGFMYFGGLNGLTLFNPNKIQINSQPPNVLITSLLINNLPLERGALLNDKIVLKKSITEADSVSFCESQRIISFEIVAEHTSAPSKNKLAYKLEGFNKEWVEIDEGKAKISYTNLAAKNYILKIKAANRDGIWSNTIKTLNITVTPLWYKTWWSYLILTLIIISVLVAIMYYFIRHEKLKQKLIFEKLDKDRTEVVNQGKFKYFTNLSHEFRTPLTLISGPLEKIIENNTDDINSKYLSIIKKNTHRLLSLIDQLITFRQAEQGFVKLNYAKLTLGDFLYPTTEAFENYATERNINFFYKIKSPNEEVIIDVEKLERILFNLLSNSFKNTPQNGSISIVASVKNKEEEKIIKIEVIDTGKGIPKEDLENIFERFYQLGNNDGQVSGGGIGLAFCKSLVDLFNGKIKVKSKENKETKFTIYIPSKKDDELETLNNNKTFIKNWVPLKSDSTEFSEKDEDKTDNKYSILIVENELDIQNFLKSALSDKYAITIANNGLEALKVVEDNNFNAIISDVMMPVIDGFELCKRLKSNPETCNIPLLLLTALENQEDLIKGLEFGADEYISKPFSLKHLELRLKKLIQNSEQIKAYFSKNSKPPKDKKDIELSEKDMLFLENITNIIENNIANSNFGVEELAREIGVSSSHFYRKLKQLTGQIPNAYLRNYRLQKAAELLASNKGYNVAEVMYQIGIESNSYFSTSFKKLHGSTPSEYLKNL